MSDKPLTIEIPEDLLKQGQSARIDVRQVVIEALEGIVAEQDLFESGTETQPAQAELEAAMAASKARMASADAPRRKMGYLQGEIWTSDDFNAEPPDAFWLGNDA